MKKGEKQKFLVGTGHGTCTCQGAAFEYILNLEFKLRQQGVRDKAEIMWISNEEDLGDFGMGGMHIKRGGYITHSKIFTESVFTERGIKWVTKSHVKEVQKGIIIAPSPPRTGMPAGAMAKIVALNIVDMIKGNADRPTRTASMAKMGAACFASAGSSPLRGSAVSMTMYPIVPDYEKYPLTGRDLTYTTGEIGLAGHWLKYLLHYIFTYKAKANPLWRVIPE